MKTFFFKYNIFLLTMFSCCFLHSGTIEEHEIPAIVVESENKSFSNPLKDTTLENKNLERIARLVKDNSPTPPRYRKSVKQMLTEKISNLDQAEIPIHPHTVTNPNPLAKIKELVYDEALQNYVQELLNDTSIQIFYSPKITSLQAAADPQGNTIFIGHLRCIPTEPRISLVDLLDPSSTIYKKLDKNGTIQDALDCWNTVLRHEFGHILTYRILTPTLHTLLLKSKIKDWIQAEEQAVDFRNPAKDSLTAAKVISLRAHDREILKSATQTMRPTLKTVEEEGAKAYFKKYKNFRFFSPLGNYIGDTNHPPDKLRVKNMLSRINLTEEVVKIPDDSLFEQAIEQAKIYINQIDSLCNLLDMLKEDIISKETASFETKKLIHNIQSKKTTLKKDLESITNAYLGETQTFLLNLINIKQIEIDFYSKYIDVMIELESFIQLLNTLKKGTQYDFVINRKKFIEHLHDSNLYEFNKYPQFKKIYDAKYAAQEKLYEKLSSEGIVPVYKKNEATLNDEEDFEF